jgi:hypothetical protein
MQETVNRSSNGAQGNRALTAELDAAKATLDRHVSLLQRSLDLHEQLQWGLLDLDDAVAAVAELKRDCRR